MKIKLSLIFIPLILLVSLKSRSQAKNKRIQKNFKVVGYYFLKSALRDTIQKDADYSFLDRVT
ncbi:MAG: hypothetical protein ACR2KZ_12855, partial [Segetibacter sp.]